MKTFQMLFLFGALAILSGCATGPVYFRYRANTQPDGAWVYEQGSPSRSTMYVRALTEAELTAAKADFPELVFEKPGYQKFHLPPGSVTLDPAALRVLRDGGWVNNTDKIILQKDMAFEGIDGANKIKLTVNSEPQGARVYSGSKLVGTTPLTLEYNIRTVNYSSGVSRLAPLVAVHDACLPERQDLELRIDPDWRYENGQNHEYAALFLLRRDPNYAPPVIVQGQSRNQRNLNLNVGREKDALDLLQQAGQIGIIFKSLQPVQ